MASAKGKPAGREPAEVPIDYRTIDRISGPLLFVQEVANAAYGEIVEISLPGRQRAGRVRSSIPARASPSSRSLDQRWA